MHLSRRHSRKTISAHSKTGYLRSTIVLAEPETKQAISNCGNDPHLSPTHRPSLLTPDIRLKVAGRDQSTVDYVNRNDQYRFHSPLLTSVRRRGYLRFPWIPANSVDFRPRLNGFLFKSFNIEQYSPPGLTSSPPGFSPPIHRRLSTQPCKFRCQRDWFLLLRNRSSLSPMWSR